MPTPSAGTDAPDFTAPTDAGSFTLSAQRGRKVVLYFYPKDATPGCTIEARGFRDLNDRFAEKNVAIVGISKDSVKSHQKFKGKECLPFELVSDDGSICEAYGAWRLKTLYGREYMGIARITILVDEGGKIAKVWDPVKASGHAAEVLAAVG